MTRILARDQMTGVDGRARHQRPGSLHRRRRRVTVRCPRRLLHRAVVDGAASFIPLTVVLELEWVLRSRYRFGEATILETFAQSMSSPEASIEAEATVAVAVALEPDGAADFSDDPQAASAHHAEKLFLRTFVRAAAD